MAPSTAVRRIRERVVQASSTSPRGRSTDSAYPSATVVVMTTYGLTTCIAPSTSRNSDGRALMMRPARSLCLETRTVCVADGTEPRFVYGVRVVPPNAPVRRRLEVCPFRLLPHTVVFHPSRTQPPRARWPRRCAMRQRPYPPLQGRTHEEHLCLSRTIYLLVHPWGTQTGPSSCMCLPLAPPLVL